ncbi:MAG: hypothetical protein FJ293_11010 [Planctomycetes bacterium]|nr:hypothetical protein [Planctomycetota bacterium]
MNLIAVAWLALSEWAGIRVVDAATRQGVPLVELETVHRVRFVTDNDGFVAIGDPDLVGREVAFTVRSHGYEFAKDGFGFALARVVPKPGATIELAVTRRQLAERLCRLTGEGRWRDSVLLGRRTAASDVPARGRVAGQDSIQPVVHGGRWFCFWGDTLRLEYPLGLFRMAGATVDLATVQEPAFDLGGGLPYDYFVDPASGFARATIPIGERPEGVVWVNGYCSVPDAAGTPRMVAWYSRRASLETELEQGLCVWDEARAIMEPVKTLPAGDWRHPSGHPLEFAEEGAKWLLFGSPCCNVRAPASYEALLDPARYEAFTCEAIGADGRGAGRPELDASGAPRWRWQKELAPLDSKGEFEWLAKGALPPDHARFAPRDAAKRPSQDPPAKDPRSEDPTSKDSPSHSDTTEAERVQLHSGSVRWNEWRQRFVLIACQIGGAPSFLGEIWYAEARHPCGPFTTAVKIATHDRMSLYNVCHHALLDRDGGRTIHFEGTYTNDFSGNPDATPRYQYNQLLFRLDLAHPGLQPALTR